MTFTRIHHVGLLVGDLEIGKRVFCEGFGLDIDEHRSPWPGRRTGDFDGVKNIEIPIGEMHLEISAPAIPDSPAGRFVSERRGGMYYLSLASDDVSADVKRLAARGIRTEGSWDDTGPAFLDPTTCLGLRLQITPEDHYFPHPHYKGNGALTGMAHVGIAARDVTKIRQLFGDSFGLHEDVSAETYLDGRVRDPKAPAGDTVQMIEFPLGGCAIEISIPLDDVNGTARLVTQRAPLRAVYHHICPYAQDEHRAVDEARVAGLEQIGSIPPREQSSRATAWFHPRTCASTLVEVWNRPPGPEHAAQYASRQQ